MAGVQRAGAQSDTPLSQREVGPGMGGPVALTHRLVPRSLCRAPRGLAGGSLRGLAGGLRSCRSFPGRRPVTPAALGVLAAGSACLSHLHRSPFRCCRRTLALFPFVSSPRPSFEVRWTLPEPRLWHSGSLQNQHHGAGARARQHPEQQPDILRLGLRQL